VSKSRILTLKNNLASKIKRRMIIIATRNRIHCSQGNKPCIQGSTQRKRYGLLECSFGVTRSSGKGGGGDLFKIIEECQLFRVALLFYFIPRMSYSVFENRSGMKPFFNYQFTFHAPQIMIPHSRPRKASK
jgi:hypothetical protein